MLFEQNLIYYPPHVVFDTYRGLYGAGYILFIFTNISETVLPTNMYYIYTSLERSSYSASTHVCYIKINAQMTEILQVKDCSCYIHWCPCFLTSFFTFSHQIFILLNP